MEQTRLKLHVRKRYLNNGSEKDASPKRPLARSQKDDVEKLPNVEKDTKSTKPRTISTLTSTSIKAKPVSKQRPSTRQSLRQTRLSSLFEKKTASSEKSPIQKAFDTDKNPTDDNSNLNAEKDGVPHTDNTNCTPPEKTEKSAHAEQASKPISEKALKRSIEALKPLESKEPKRQRPISPEEVTEPKAIAQSPKEITPPKDAAQPKDTLQSNDVVLSKSTLLLEKIIQARETGKGTATQPDKDGCPPLEKDTLSIDSSKKENPAKSTAPELVSPQPRRSVSTSITWQTEKSRIADEQKTLERLRDALDISLTFHAGHSRVVFFHKIQRMLCNSTQKNITLVHIAKILYLTPEFYLVEARILKEFGRMVETYAVHFGKDWTVPLSGKDLEKRKTILTERIREYFDTHTETKATIPEAPLPKMEKVVDTSTWLQTAKLPPGVRSLLEMQERRKKESETEKQPRQTPTGTVRDRSKALLERIRAKQQQKKDAL